MGKIIHGHSRYKQGPTPEYRAYHAMKTRCLNDNAARFEGYGRRGIEICPRWLVGENGKTVFECFLADMGSKPTPKHTLDRKNNDEGYRPSNCRWATPFEQARNARSTRWVSIDGTRMSFAEAVERFGAVSYRTARMRVHRGMDDVAAITTPLLPRHNFHERSASDGR